MLYSNNCRGDGCAALTQQSEKTRFSTVEGHSASFGAVDTGVVCRWGFEVVSPRSSDNGNNFLYRANTKAGVPLRDVFQKILLFPLVPTSARIGV